MPNTKRSTKRTAVAEPGSKGFTTDEKAAMRERAKELKAESRASTERADGERDILAKIAQIGLMTLVTGGVLRGTIPWPWMIAVFVLGAPALALLLVRPVRTDIPPFASDRKDRP